ncbi:MAG: hypothetical protein QOJ76_1631 [Acidobacteriota bacterium]|nr:hypothetical protein [Acidobacteriota bacterium]
MKGDFTRLTFDPKKRYSGVLMQQGRVQLDADWNEQLDIIMHRIETETRDFIGMSGAPVDDPGFELLARSWLLFDGVNDYVYAEGRRDFSFAGDRPFTLEAWVQPGVGCCGGTLLGKFRTEEGENHLRGEYYLEIDADLTVSFHRVEVIKEDCDEEAAEEPPLAEDEEEHFRRTLVVRTAQTSLKLSPEHLSHVAATFDGRRSRVYINGQLAASMGRLRSGVRTHSPFLIGAHIHGDERVGFFKGKLNEIRVWKTDRSQEEIQRTMHVTLSGHEPELVAYWRADEMTGDTLRDITGHGHAALLGRGDPECMPRLVSGELRIGRGRFYVDGLLCENEKEVSYGEQEDYPGATLPLPATGQALYLAYLDAWLRYVSSTEDPSIRETALGGPDTAGRAQVVAQVKLLPLDARNDSLHFDERHPDWREFVEHTTRKALMSAERQPTASYLGNQLYRVEVHTGGALYAAPRSDRAHGTSVEVRESETEGELLVAVGDWVVDGIALQVGQAVEIFSTERGAERQLGPLRHIVTANQAEKTMTLSPPTDFSRQTDVRLRPVVTIKWSRENGSVVFPVISIDRQQGTITLSDLGRDEYALQVGDWVEVLDDAYVLTGQSAPLCQVSKIDSASLRVTVTGTIPSGVGDDSAYHPRIRRWDQKADDGSGLTDGGVIAIEAFAQSNAWLPLESGIQVKFTDSGTLQTGDYWMIPSRTLTGGIEWPQTDSQPSLLPPRGIKHHYAPLALVLCEGQAIRVRDYRRKFAPLTALDPDEERWYVKKTGDTMSGELRIENSLHVAGEISGERLSAHEISGERLSAHLIVTENIEAAELHGRLDADVVGEEQIIDKAVTRAKLADDVWAIGSFPPGYSLLGDSTTPPPGYTYTESIVFAANRHSAWQIKAVMEADNIARLFGAAVGDRIYTFTDAGAVWEYDTKRAIWREKSTVPSGARPLGVAALNDLIYVFCASGDVWEYDPAPGDREQAWTQKESMPKPRHAFGIAASGGRIYLTGGRRKIFFGLFTVTTRANESYDPATDTWRKRRSLPRRRYAFGALAEGDRIYAVGGNRRYFFGLFKRQLRSSVKYSTAADRWSEGFPLMPAPRSSLGAGVVDREVCVFGGNERDGWTRTNEALAPSKEWSEAPPLPVAIAFPCVVIVGGRAYAFGPDASNPRTCVVAEWTAGSIYYVHRKDYVPAGDSSAD